MVAPGTGHGGGYGVWKMGAVRWRRSVVGALVVAAVAAAPAMGAPGDAGSAPTRDAHVAQADERTHRSSGGSSLGRPLGAKKHLARLGCSEPRRAHLNADRRPEWVCWVPPANGYIGDGRLLVRLSSGKVLRRSLFAMDHKSGITGFIQADRRRGKEILLRLQRNSTSTHFVVIALRGQRLVKIGERIRMN